MTDPTEPTDITEFVTHLTHPLADLAPRSRAAVKAARTLWEQFADPFGLDPDAGSIDANALACFALARLQTGTRHNTVERDLWALTRARQAETNDHRQVDGPARAVIRGWLANHRPQPVKQATVLPRWFLVEMLVAIRTGEPGYHREGEWRAARDRAFLAVAYATALRTSSLNDLQLDQLHRDTSKWQLRLATSKGNQPSGTGWSEQTVELTTLPAPLDPVSALDDWVEIRGGKDGALFPSRPHTADTPVTGNTMLARLQDVADRCGDIHGAFTLASLRRSWATHARLDGASIAAIGRHLLHKSEHVTHRYVANLQAYVSDGDARSYYLPTVRPADATYDFGQRARDTFGQAWQPPETELDELARASKHLAQVGAVTACELVRKQARAVRARLDDYCHGIGADPADPGDDVVAQFVLAEYGYGHPEGPRLRAVTVRGYVDALTLSWQLEAPEEVPPTGMAAAIADQLVRREGQAPQTQAPIPPDGEADLLRMIDSRTPVTRTLDTAVLRWHMHRAGLPLARRGSSNPAWKQLTTDNVTVSTDTVTLTADDTTVVLHGEANPLTCPVRAAESLLAAAESGQRLLPEIVLKGSGAELRRHFDISGVPERWTRLEFEVAASALSTNLRRYHRDRMMVAVLYAGALRGADLRGSRIEDLERHPYGYVLHLRGSKQNRRGEPESVPLTQRDDDLCPATLIDEFLATWPFDHGPLLVGHVEDRTHRCSTPPPAMAGETLIHAVKRMGAAAGIDVTGHSFRRLAATITYDETGDLDEVQRLLRHRNKRFTRRYVEPLTPRLTTSADTKPTPDSKARFAKERSQ